MEDATTMMEGEDDEDDMIVITCAVRQLLAANVVAGFELLDEDTKVDHRTPALPRKPRRKYHHDEVAHCIKREYIGPSSVC